MSTKRNSTKNSTQPQTLTRRELLKALAILPAAALPTLSFDKVEPPTAAPAQPEPETGQLCEEAKMITRVLIPALKTCIANAEARLIELAGGGVA